MSTIGIVCGLKSEAAAVRTAIAGAGLDARIRIGISGANAARAGEIAYDFAKGGVRVLISVGVSGGLDGALAPGDLLIGDHVVTGDGERFSCDEDMLCRLRGDAPDGFSRNDGQRALYHDEQVILLGANEIIQSPEQKRKLFQETKAVAVDMESHAVARVARENDIPFLAIRAVADPADRALPPAAMNAVAPDGSTRVLKTLLETAKAPGQFPALLKLGSDSEKALSALRRDLGGLLARLFLRFDL